MSTANQHIANHTITHDHAVQASENEQNASTHSSAQNSNSVNRTASDSHIRSLLHTRSTHLGGNLSLSYSSSPSGPLYLTHAAAQYMYDSSNKRYLDLVNNVCHIGHCHTHVTEAIVKQSSTLNTNTRYLYDSLFDYTKALLATFPAELSVCYFVNSGSEANELALRLAKTYTNGATHLICLDHAYHGNTSACIDISPYKFNGKGGAGCPSHVHIATVPDGYRGPYKYNDPHAAVKYASDVQRKVEEIAASGGRLAAFIAESVLGCAGQVYTQNASEVYSWCTRYLSLALLCLCSAMMFLVSFLFLFCFLLEIFLPSGYLKAAYKHVRAAGGVCIADEVQVGLGRVGSQWWAFQTQDVIPDIVTLGKPLGNGFPLAAVVTTKAIADRFNNGMEYFNTFGGSTLSCAVGLAVLEVMQHERLMEHAAEVGEYMLQGLKRLQTQFATIGDVRGECSIASCDCPSLLWRCAISVWLVLHNSAVAVFLF